MFKVFFILIILHGFNCCSMDDDKIWVTNEELILKNTIGRIFSEIIISMDEECCKVGLSSDSNLSVGHIVVNIDSWNNIRKYEDISGAFFIFVEQ